MREITGKMRPSEENDAKERKRERERFENQFLQVFSARVELEPATPDKEGKRAKRITIGDGNSIARSQSS
jgi:hypothetical protein